MPDAPVPDAPRLSVVVPTVRRFEPCLDTLRDLLVQDHDAFEVVVVDQNAAWPDALVARREALRADARVQWLTVAPNGVVAARHDAVEAARGSLFVFVDDDVAIPYPTFLTRHERLYDDPTVDAVAGRELSPTDALPGPGAVTEGPVSDWTDRRPVDQAFTFSRASDHPARVCTFSTCNGSVRRTAFLAIGGFDEQFAGASYGDDYDFAIRLTDAGGRILYSPDPWLVHLRVPMGGLRFTDAANRASGRDRALAPLLFSLRHRRRGSARRVWFDHLLRKTVLLRANVVRPWRQVAACGALAAALPAAVRAVRRGARSRFTPSR